MPSATWNSGASTDMNNTANYSAVWDATYDLVWDATSTVNCTATAPVSCNSITVAAAYTGAWSISGQTLTVAVGASWDGTGTLNLGNGVTANGASGTVHVGSGVGTVTASSCALVMNGTTAMVLDDDKAITFKSLTLGANAVVTNSGANYSIYTSATSPLTFTNGGTLTLSTTMFFGLTANGAIVTITAGTPTINGTASMVLRYGNGVAATIPALTLTGTANINITDLTSACDGSVTLTGNLSCLGIFALYSGQANSDLTFSTGNYSISSGDFRVGANNASATIVFNAGASTVTCTSYTATYNAATTQSINLQTSQWTCTGAWTYGSNHTVNVGTFVLNLTGTAAQTITSNGKSFYDVNINRATAGTCTFADATSLHDLVFNAANTQAISWTGTTMTASGNMTMDGSGTLNCGNGITATGASATVHFGSTLGTVTATSCVLTMNGTTGMVLDADKALAITRIVIGASAVVTNSGSAAITSASTTGALLSVGNNAILTNNATLTWRPFSTMTIFTLGTGITLNGTGAHNITSGGTGITVTIPAITYTGSGTLTISDDANNLDSMVVTNSGAISWGPTAMVIITVGVSALVRTFTTTLANNMTCGTLRIGTPAASKTIVFNGGSAVESISVFDGSTINIGPCNINLQTSQISCAGNWTFGSNQTVNPGTSTVTITNTSTITSASKSFYNFAINAAGRTITLSGALTIATGGSVTVTAFTAFAGGQYIVFAGSGSITIATNVSNRLRTAVAGSTITWNTGASTWTFPAYTANDFGGSASGRVVWRSSSAGTQFRIAAPAATINVSYMEFGDANNSAGGTIYALDGTSVDNGNNVNILFPSPLAQTGNSNSQISITMGM